MSAGSSLADLKGGTVPPRTHPAGVDIQYQGALQGMGALTVSPEQPSHQYQSHTIPQQNGYMVVSAGAQNNNGSLQQHQQQVDPFAQPDSWGAPAPPSPQQQQHQR